MPDPAINSTTVQGAPDSLFYVTREELLDENLYHCQTHGSMIECPHLVITVGDNPNIIPALVDSGAEVSCINKEYYDALRQDGARFIETRVESAYIVTATGASSKKIDIQARIPIACQGIEMVINALVVTKLVKDVILAGDWLQKYGATISYRERRERSLPEGECALRLRDGREIFIVRPSDSSSAAVRDEDDPHPYVTVTSLSIMSASIKNVPADSNLEGPPKGLQSDNLLGGRHLSEEYPTSQLQRELTMQQTNQLNDVLTAHARVFSDTPGQTHLYTHKLNITNTTPFCGRTYPVPHIHREAVQSAINDMMRMDVVERADALFMNPLVVVSKKDSSKLRVCLDARELNKRVSPEYERPEKIADLLRRFHGKTWLSSLDLTNGYWQIPLAAADRKYTGFGFAGIGYRFKRVPFGVKSASSGFIRALHLALGDAVSEFVAVYIDDIVIYSDSFEDHLRHVDVVLTKLEEAGLTVKESKSVFCRQQISFLGHRISAEGLEPDPVKVEAIQDFPTPRTQRQLRGFLGLCNYFRQFVPNYARTVEDMRGLLGGKVRWKWTEAANRAFNDLKDAFKKRVMLNQPDFEQPFRIDTDASYSGIAGVLYQEVDGERRIISLASRGLSDAEKRFTVSEVEMLAIVFAVTKFREYVLGRHLTIVTDHKALQFLMSSKLNSSRLTRWVLYLQEYNFDVVYRPGKENLFCDFLSRHPVVDGKCASEADVSKGILVGMAKFNLDADVRKRLKCFREFQAEDASGRRMLNRLEAKSAKPTDGHDLKFRLVDGYIYHADQVGELKLWVPGSLVKEIVWSYHLDTGHSGPAKCYDAIRREFWWHGMTRAIRQILRACERCQKTKFPNHYLEGKWNNVLPTKKGELVLCDFFGPLPRTRGSFQYILVIIDGFTKHVKLYPLCRATTGATLKKFLGDYCKEQGKPQTILSDNGSQFTSPAWSESLEKEGIKSIRCSIRDPKGNLCERVMARLGQAFRVYCSHKHTLWIEWMALVERWINHTTHSSTGCTPVELQTGKAPTYEIPRLLGINQDRSIDMEWQIRMSQQRMRKAGVERGKQQRKVRVEVFEPGEKVLLRVPGVSNSEKREMGKLFELYQGPFLIRERIRENTYLLETLDGRFKGQHNVRALRRYYYEEDYPRVNPCLPKRGGVSASFYTAIGLYGNEETCEGNLQSGQGRPHMTVAVGDSATHTSALLDSGAELSCISLEFYQGLLARGEVFPVIPVTSVDLVTATGYRSKKVRRQARVNIMCQSLKMDVNVLVVPGLVKDLVLANDWLADNQAVLGYGANSSRALEKDEHRLMLQNGRPLYVVPNDASYAEEAKDQPNVVACAAASNAQIVSHQQAEWDSGETIISKPNVQQEDLGTRADDDGQHASERETLSKQLWTCGEDTPPGEERSTHRCSPITYDGGDVNHESGCPHPHAYYAAVQVAFDWYKNRTTSPEPGAEAMQTNYKQSPIDRAVGQTEELDCYLLSLYGIYR